MGKEKGPKTQRNEGMKPKREAAEKITRSFSLDGGETLSEHLVLKGGEWFVKKEYDSGSTYFDKIDTIDKAYSVLQGIKRSSTSETRRVGRIEDINKQRMGAGWSPMDDSEELVSGANENIMNAGNFEEEMLKLIEKLETKPRSRS